MLFEDCLVVVVLVPDEFGSAVLVDEVGGGFIFREIIGGEVLLFDFVEIVESVSIELLDQVVLVRLLQLVPLGVGIVGFLQQDPIHLVQLVEVGDDVPRTLLLAFDLAVFLL